MSREYDVHRIIARALQLGIDLSVVNGELKIKAAKGVITVLARTKIAEYKAEIIREMTPLCATCLDQGSETPALPDHYETYMYCAAHHPVHCAQQVLGQRIIAMQNEIDARLATKHETVQPVEQLPRLATPFMPLRD